MGSDVKKPLPYDFLATTDTGDMKEKLVKEVLQSSYIDHLRNDTPKNANYAWLTTVEVVSAERFSPSSACIVYRFPVLHEYLNPTMNLHGGQSAAMYDMATTWLLTLVRRPGFWMTHGTTRTLNITYLRPAPEGTMLLMECEIVHVGKKLCLLKGELKREDTGALISTCEHQKFNIDPEEPKL